MKNFIKLINFIIGSPTCINEWIKKDATRFYFWDSSALYASSFLFSIIDYYRFYHATLIGIDLYNVFQLLACSSFSLHKVVDL